MWRLKIAILSKMQATVDIPWDNEDAQAQEQYFAYTM